jgi:hypothetical protein
MSNFRIAFLIWLSLMLPLVVYLSFQSFTGEFSTPLNTDNTDCAASS